MGTWGFNFAENDDAAAWLGDFADAPTWVAIDTAFEQVNRSVDDYIEAPECQAAVAAVAVVAAGVGSAPPSLHEAISAWATAHADDAQRRVGPARLALMRIRDASELQELWDEGEEAPLWRATLDDLTARLG